MKKVLLTFSALIAAGSLSAAPVPLSLAPVSGTGSVLDLASGVPNMLLGVWDNETGDYAYSVAEAVIIFGGGTVVLDGALNPVKVNPPETDTIFGSLLSVTHDGYVDGAGDPINLLDGGHYVVILPDGFETAADDFLAGVIVPEPHEYALLAGVGLLGLAAYRRLRA